MAVYIDTEQVAGIAGIPSLTLEQYNALEVKPKLWFLLNPPEGYKRLSADEVSYDGTSSGLSATDTQGAIDEVNGKVDTKADKVWKKFGSFELTNNVTGDWNADAGATLANASEVLFFVSIGTGGSPRNSITCPLNVLDTVGVFYDFNLASDRSYFFIGKSSATVLRISQTNVNVGLSRIFIWAYYR